MIMFYFDIIVLIYGIVMTCARLLATPGKIARVIKRPLCPEVGCGMLNISFPKFFQGSVHPS